MVVDESGSVGSPTFALTQEFIAHMLGTRRASVTVAAGTCKNRTDYLHTRKGYHQKDELTTLANAMKHNPTAE